MPLTPFYFSEVLAPSSFEAAILVLQIAKSAIGLGIAYIAYRGYREHASRPMLYISIGFILVLGLPFILSILGVSLVASIGLPVSIQAAIISVSELSQVVGLVIILYALRM